MEDKDVVRDDRFNKSRIDFVNSNKFRISRYKIPMVPSMNKTKKKFEIEEEFRKTTMKSSARWTKYRVSRN